MRELFKRPPRPWFWLRHNIDIRLRDPKVQEEYREFVQEKVKVYWRKYPLHSALVGDEKHRQETEQNLLILFRKLREGLLSTGRNDSFAFEVYETSLYLSILFRSPTQTTSILSHLPRLYLTLSPQASVPQRPYAVLQASIIISLLHYLLAGYPSQSRYFEHLHSLPRTFLPRGSDAYRWMADLTQALRMRNYARFETVTHRTMFEKFVGTSKEKFAAENTQTTDTKPSSLDLRQATYRGDLSSALNTGMPPNLAFEATCTLVDALRAKARETTWLVLRSAYRELHCSPRDRVASVHDSPYTTSEWLVRSLTLRPVLSDGTNITLGKLINDWLEHRCAEGEVRRKGEGIEGRWIICKVPLKR
ncbi:hypothetical protein AcV5_007499 [Taiwanofungus camphoratus]|nr:hypothetical protein AcV5_007499 [Antrodia cinnamomea]